MRVHYNGVVAFTLDIMLVVIKNIIIRINVLISNFIVYSMKLAIVIGVTSEDF